MSGSRKPGVSGRNPASQDLSDGTLVCRLTPPPGPLGVQNMTLAGGPTVVRSANATASAAASAVANWSLTEKFAEALRRTAPKLPGSMRREFEALLTPTSLAIMAGTLAAWAASHLIGVGEVADVVLLVGGAFFLGFAVIDVAREFYDFVSVTYHAQNEQDLDRAASHLARVIAIIGVAAFIALLAKLARGRGAKGRTTEPPAAPPEAPPPRKAPPPPGPEKPVWKLGDHKSAQKFRNQMQKRGWTPEQIDEAMARGQRFPAPNQVNPGNPATRYVHPETGRSVIVDDVTKEVLHVGGDGFKY